MRNMSSTKSSKFGRFRALVAGFLVFLSLFIGMSAGFLVNSDVYAVPKGLMLLKKLQIMIRKIMIMRQTMMMM